MKKIKQPNNQYAYKLGSSSSPIANIKINEEVEIYTADAFAGKVTKESDIPSKVIEKYTNPQTGPLFIEGAEPGDTLVVHIIDLQPTRDWAVSLLDPYSGGLTTTHTTRMLHEHLPEHVWVYEMKNGKFTNGKLTFPFEPMIGTIGTSPELEEISSLTPGKHGGNMDVPDIKPGNTLHLPVNVDGAYFYIGDCHAKQGEGELCGVALEIPMKVTLKFELIKNKEIKWPRIISENEIMAVGSAKPMEDAARIAYSELITWMEEMGWDKFEAYQILTQVGKLYVANMVNPNYSLVAKVDKMYTIQNK